MPSLYEIDSFCTSSNIFLPSSGESWKRKGSLEVALFLRNKTKAIFSKYNYKRLILLYISLCKLLSSRFKCDFRHCFSGAKIIEKMKILTVNQSFIHFSLFATCCSFEQIKAPKLYRNPDGKIRLKKVKLKVTRTMSLIYKRARSATFTHAKKTKKGNQFVE